MEKIFTIKTSLKQGWEATKNNILVLLGLYLGCLLISSLLSWIPMGMPPLSVTSIVVNIILLAFSLIFTVGYLKICLQAADGEEPSFSAFGEMMPRVLPYIVCTVIIMVGYIIGLILLVIPGFYFLIRTQFALYFLIEGSGPIESIKKSWELTDGHVLKLLGQIFVYLGLILLGIVLLVVGLFVTSIWIQETYARTYRLLQAEQALKKENRTESLEMTSEN